MEGHSWTKPIRMPPAWDWAKSAAACKSPATSGREYHLRFLTTVFASRNCNHDGCRLNETHHPTEPRLDRRGPSLD